jgi:hypothetical protein
MPFDGGSLLRREIDQAMGLATSMSQALCDPRDPAKVRHAQEELLRQRLFTIAMEMVDVGSQFKLTCGRIPSKFDKK